MIPLLVTLAWADEPSEDDLFGAPPPETPPPAAPGEPEFQGDLGEDKLTQTTDADIAKRLGLADDKLAIGGKLYLRGNVYVREDTGAAATSGDNPNLLDLYVDVRPNDRVRAFASGRFKYDFTIQDGDTDSFGNTKDPGSVTLDQAWLKFDVGRTLFVTAGRQRIKWGAGRFWNPTDFMNNQTLNSLAFFDERTGVGLLKLHVPVESLGGNIYALANFEGADKLDQVGGAARIEWILGPSEVSLSSAWRKDQPYKFGGDISAGLGPFDVHVESAVQHGPGLYHYKTSFDLLDPDYENIDFENFALVETLDWSEKWVPQVVGGFELGIKYSDEDSLYVGAEYFYNGMGYANSDDYFALAMSGAFKPFYLGQHYGGLYVYIPGPGELDDTSFTVSALANLSDQTGALRLDVSQTALTYIKLNAYVSSYVGRQGGEFRFAYDLPYTTNLGVDLSGIPGMEEALGQDTLDMLANGIPDLHAPVVDFGVGAQVNF